MLIDHQTITHASALADQVGESVFRFSTVENISIEGGYFDATFLSCSLNNVDIYWGIFNLCVFVECIFTNCTFRGTAFPGCKFVECSFVDCRFLKDNLNADCSFDEAKWYGCTQKNTEGLGPHVRVAA